MKIKVTPEGRDEIYLVEKEDIVAWLKAQSFEDDKIHTFIPSGAVLLGFDDGIDSIIDEIENADRLGIVIGEASKNNMGHSLSIIKGNQLNMCDIGELTVDDLEVVTK